ncbi:hypothetical protein BDN72DRAFT_393382 [Pluteus cervinus]|uniref:Uncharacterized protein n=1 Tax=Pluteus cervinus TaxID=181527 RepID=A0ACD3A9M2_9AGAR|nr:hypothetical protein BDN72DRAFT_393382 [Pluteus cervinus]
MSSPASPYNTVGALQVGVLISMFLFGIATLQAHVYVRKFAEDPLVVKLMVLIVWTLELAHTVAVSNGLYFMVVAQYTNPQANVVQDLDPGFRIAVLFSGCIAASVQAYFTHRLRVVSGKLAIPIAFYILAAMRFVGWVWASIMATVSMQPPGEAHAHAGWAWPFVPLLAGGAVVDVTLAALVCIHFSQSRAKAGINAPLMDKLMLWTIQNGLLTGLAGLTTAICLITMRDNYIWVAVFLILTRLFSNSFMASLNARQHLRRYRHQHNASTDPILPYHMKKPSYGDTSYSGPGIQAPVYLRSDTPSSTYTLIPS